MLTTFRTDTALGYSQAVRAGNLLFVSGQVAVDERGQVVGGGDIRAHVDQVFKNLRAVVEAGGSRLDLVTKLTLFTTSLNYLPAIREAVIPDATAPAGRSRSRVRRRVSARPAKRARSAARTRRR